MANTTFKGPVTSLHGFIGGPNPNANTAGTTSDTQQGGTTIFYSTNVTTLTNGTDTLVSTTNEGVMVYCEQGTNATTNSYVFSNGTTWKQLAAPTTDVNIKA